MNKNKNKSIQCEFKQCSQKAERQGITLWPVTGHSRVPFQCIISHNQLYNGWVGWWRKWFWGLHSFCNTPTALQSSNPRAKGIDHLSTLLPIAVYPHRGSLERLSLSQRMPHIKNKTRTKKKGRECKTEKVIQPHALYR